MPPKPTIEYDGEGDSGQIENIRFDSGGILIPDQPLPGTTKRLFSQPHFSPQTLREALEAFAWELLAVYHDGFENNEGAFGIVTIDVAKNSVVLEAQRPHRRRVHYHDGGVRWPFLTITPCRRCASGAARWTTISPCTAGLISRAAPAAASLAIALSRSTQPAPATVQACVPARRIRFRHDRPRRAS